MKKIMILLIALVMALSAMPVSAAESTPMEIANPEIEVLTSFASCTTGCGGLVVLNCSGRMESDTDPAGFTCNLPEHNEYEPCNHYKVVYKTEGYCNNCGATVSGLRNSDWGFPDLHSFHIHSYKHIFSTGYGAYRTEYWPACYV